MLLIRNGYIKTMAGEDIAAGCVLVGDDGKIAAVGENILAPEGAEVIDAKGMLVTPGCVDGHSHIGIRDSASGREGNDFNEKSDPIAPHMRAIDGIYPQDEAFALAVKGEIFEPYVHEEFEASGDFANKSFGDFSLVFR